MRVLVIGGTGFIGKHVAQRLIEAGHAVTVFHRGQTGADLPAEVNHIFGERSDLASFSPEFRDLEPDVALDMICYTGQESLALVSALQSACKRLVVASSMDVYRNYGRLLGLEQGPPDSPPMDEDSPLRESRYPHRAISKSPRDFAATYDKIPVERTVSEAAMLQATILRLPAVYGPGDKYHRTFEYLKRMDDGREKIILEETRARWLWTRGYVENVADAIALAVTDERAASRVFNVGEPDALSEADWVRSIGQAANWRGEVAALPREKMPAHLVAPYRFEHHLHCDTSRIRRELNYSERVPREEAMRRTIDWERSHPPDEIDMSGFDYAAEDAAQADLTDSRGFLPT
ncbi:MAG TPA: NAD-dependent epimerase/dehydratase family protein [Blastocatellia bacterium]|nr:NAD-dependent epimerase/dehydratase family protein [Blastocatellia bacterium]